MSSNPDAKPANEQAPYVDPESLALQMAINSHVVIESDIGSPYLEGRRDAYLQLAVAIGGHNDPALSRTVTQLRQALHDGVTEVDALREIVTRSTGQFPSPRPALDWVGPKAFEAQHGDRGLDEDFGMRWGDNRDVRISFKRQPGDHEGLLYAYDKTWDTYAVISPSTSRTVVQRAYQQALAANPEMTAEVFAGYHHIVTTAAHTAARARAVSL